MNDIAALHMPAHVNFDVTYKCNARCSFCYVIDREQEEKIDLDKAKRVLEHLYDSGIMRINYFGGEPTIVKELPELMLYASMLGMRVTMVTNGLRLTEEYIDRINGSLDVLAISVHGVGEAHDEILNCPGAFSKLCRHLDYLSSRSIRIGLNFTVLNNSEDQFRSTTQYLLQRWPISFISANRFVGGHGKDDSELSPSIETLNNVLCIFEELEEQFPEVTKAFAIYFPLCLIENPRHMKYLKGCGLGTNFLSVDFQGNVRMCSYSNYTLGNVLLTPLSDIWNGHPIYREYRRGEWIPDSCQSCDVFHVCQSGCRVSDSSKIFGPDVLTRLKPISAVKLQKSA